jgi:pyruvate formate lyase activating enzyme
MASLFKKMDNKLECQVCPHYCKLSVGQTGICGVRKNTGEKIELTTYGVLSGYSVDPLEKKPLYHFYPGHNILSLGSYGCNMRCDFCQNYQISQSVPKSIIPGISVNRIIADALSSDKNIGIAFTYNEPVIWFEYMRDIATLAKKEGLSCVMVSNGFVNKDILEEILKFTDAFNIDLKAFNDTFYRKLTGAELEPVKCTLKTIAESGKHLEVTTLIVPGQNDSEVEMMAQTEWMANELGPDIPFHLSRYFPTYKRNDPSTTEDSLNKLSSIALKNLNYVYVGNITSDKGHNTSCPECGTVVTIRSGYKTRLTNLDEEGKCTKCGNPIYKDFIFSW